MLEKEINKRVNMYLQEMDKLTSTFVRDFLQVMTYKKKILDLTNDPEIILQVDEKMKKVNDKFNKIEKYKKEFN